MLRELHEEMAEIHLAPDGAVRSATPEAAALLGIRHRKLIGRDFFDVVFPPSIRSHERKAFEQLVAAGVGSRSTRDAPVADGSTIVRWRWSVARDGTRPHVVVRALPVPRTLASSGALEHNRLATLGLLATAIAHEIISPLSGVRACIQSLRDENLTVTEREAYFGVVLDSLDRMHHIASQALEFGRRPAAPSRRAVEPKSILDACTLLLKPRVERKSLRIEANIACAAKILGDRSQLMQALMNVLTNAIDASPEGSVIGIHILRRNRSVEVSVRDAGPGIPRRSLAALGVPFFTTKASDGTGLGISVTRSIVEAHRGRILFRSRLGEGTTVTLVLPAASSGNGSVSSR